MDFLGCPGILETFLAAFGGILVLRIRHTAEVFKLNLASVPRAYERPLVMGTIHASKTHKNDPKGSSRPRKRHSSSNTPSGNNEKSKWGKHPTKAEDFLLLTTYTSKFILHKTDTIMSRLRIM